MRHQPFSVFLLLLALLASCSTKRVFEPPLRSENEVLKMEVRKVQYKKKHLRIWVSLTNRSEDTLVVGYRDFSAEGAGKTLPGALRVPFVRVGKDFEMHPKMHKYISQPIEFLGFEGAPLPQVRLALKNIRIKGQVATSEVALDVPVDGAAQ